MQYEFNEKLNLWKLARLRLSCKLYFFCIGYPLMGNFDNSEAKDEMQQNAAFRQGLHGLLA